MCAPLNGLTEAWNGSGGVGDRRMGSGSPLRQEGGGGSTTGGEGGTEAEKGH